MADILMYTDMDRYNEQIRLKSVHLDKLTEILQAYNAMNIGDITGNEFKRLVQNHASFIFDKMTNGQDVVIGGLKVNKAKAIEILEKPKGYDELQDKITRFQHSVPQWHHHLSHIDIDGNSVVISQQCLDAELEASKIYAKTDNEKKALEIAQAIKALWEEKFADQRFPSFHLVSKLVQVQTKPFNSIRKEDQSLVINYEGIRHIAFNY